MQNLTVSLHSLIRPHTSMSRMLKRQWLITMKKNYCVRAAAARWFGRVTWMSTTTSMKFFLSRQRQLVVTMRKPFSSTWATAVLRFRWFIFIELPLLASFSCLATLKRAISEATAKVSKRMNRKTRWALVIDVIHELMWAASTATLLRFLMGICSMVKPRNKVVERGEEGQSDTFFRPSQSH